MIREQGRELKIDELMKLLDKKQSEYGSFAKMLQRMVRENELIRTEHGRYALKWVPEWEKPERESYDV